jgi:hypothetical protein
MEIPNWYSLFLVSAAAWRTFQLISQDEILDRPRRWFMRLGDSWKKDGDPVPDNYRVQWALFILCPYCLGAWVGLAWWVAWQIDSFWTEVVAIPFVISAGVVALHKLLREPEE